MELLNKMKEVGDYRGAAVAVREARECLELASKLAAEVAGARGSGGTVTIKFIGETE